MFPLALRKSGVLSKIDGINSPRDRLIYLLISELGLKVSEVSSLKKSDFLHDRLKIHNLEIKLSNIILETLSDYCEKVDAKIYQTTVSQDSYIFKTRQGTRISERRIQQILSSYGLEAPSAIRAKCILKSISTAKHQEVKAKFGLKSLREKEYLSTAKVQALNNFLKSTNNLRDQTLSSLFLESGLTLSQVINLEKSDIVSNSIKIKIFDNRFSNNGENKVKIIPLSNHIIKNLKRISLSSSSQYIFSSRQGTKYSERRIQQIFDNYSSILGFKITPQIMRNTFVASKISTSSKLDSKQKIKPNLKPENTNKLGNEFIAKIRIYDGYHGLPKGETETT